MRRLCLAVMLITLARLSPAQGDSITVAQAEAQGAVFPQAPPPATPQPPFADRPFTGSTKRRCVAALHDDPLRSFRSGEFVVRTIFTGPYGLRAGKGSKVLWMPVHDPGPQRVSLRIRAVRLGNRPDSLELTLPRVARSVRGSEFGYPSTVRFPTAGQWLVVATTGDDWGCFLLDVAD
jgi:hypothetical protein